MMRMKEEWKEIVTAGLDLIFPPSCNHCDERTGGGENLLCEECCSQLKRIRRPYCSCCGRVFPGTGDNHLCGDCLTPSWAFDTARSIFAFEDVIAGLVHTLKYAGDMSALDTIKWISGRSTVLQDFEIPDIILPVPLHKKRLRKRGFNQALLLALEIFSNDRKKIVVNLLKRQADTASQTSLSGIERRKNLRNAFRVDNPSKVVGLNALIVDDVFTTGSTVNECAIVLKAAGAKRVDVLTLCRADKFIS